MKLSYFDLFKDTYFSDMQNTLHFDSNDDRDAWFDNYKPQIRFESPFNFRRDRGIVRVDRVLEDLQGYNYGRFWNGYDDKLYYFYIVSMKYLNDNTTQLDIVIDPVMTYTQGDVLMQLRNIEVTRQHYTNTGYQLNLQVLKQNSDYIPCTGFIQRYEKKFTFDEFVYCINSSVDLGENYGSTEKPVMVYAKGRSIDNISGGNFIYLTEDITEFFKHITYYPWIAQCIQEVTVIPKYMMDNYGEQWDEWAMYNGGPTLKCLRSGISQAPDPVFEMSPDDLRSFLGIYGGDFNCFDNMLKQGLLQMYITNHQGQKLVIEPEFVRDGFKMKVIQTIGYKNNITLRPTQYKTIRNAGVIGEGLDYSISLSNFDRVGFNIDNQTLYKASVSYGREQAKSNTLSGRINRATDSGNNLTDRLFSAVSVYSDVFSGGLTSAPAKAVGLFSNEYEQQRQWLAQDNQAMVTAPSVNVPESTNALQFADGCLGFVLKVFIPTPQEVLANERYFGKYGYDDGGRSTQLYDITSMQYCNWVQFKGNYTIPGVDTELHDQLKTLFEAGVRLWHDYNAMQNADMSTNYIIK